MFVIDEKAAKPTYHRAYTWKLKVLDGAVSFEVTTACGKAVTADMIHSSPNAPHLVYLFCCDECVLVFSRV